MKKILHLELAKTYLTLGGTSLILFVAEGKAFRLKQTGELREMVQETKVKAAYLDAGMELWDDNPQFQASIVKLYSRKAKVSEDTYREALLAYIAEHASSSVIADALSNAEFPAIAAAAGFTFTASIDASGKITVKTHRPTKGYVAPVAVVEKAA